jgi:hypothetical protein
MSQCEVIAVRTSFLVSLPFMVFRRSSRDDANPAFAGLVLSASGSSQ